MYFISIAEAIASDPGENWITILREGEDAILIADIEENINIDWSDPSHDDTHGYRVEIFEGQDWTLPREWLLDPEISAMGELRGERCGGIIIGYDYEDDWDEYENAYDCLVQMVEEYSLWHDEAHEQVAVIEKIEEVYDLPEGVWHMIVDLPTPF